MEHKIEIRFAKKVMNKAKESLYEPIGDFCYTIVISFEGDNETGREKIGKTILEICDQYRGDMLDHFFEKEACVFCCYIIEGERREEIYVSDPKNKIDPLAIVDGMIRRMTVTRVTFTNGEITQTLTEPKVDQEDIIADYSSEEEEGEKIKVFFPYRDTGASNIPEEYRYNQMLADNFIPFFFILSGKITYKYKQSNYSVQKNFALSLKKQELYLEEKNGKDKIIWLLKGSYDCKVSVEDYIPDYDEYFSEDYSEKHKGLYYKSRDHVLVRPWYEWEITNVSGDEDLIVRRLKLSEVIKRGKQIDSDQLLLLKSNTYRQIDKMLALFGLRLGTVKGYKDRREEQEREKYSQLSVNQTKKICEKFPGKEACETIEIKMNEIKRELRLEPNKAPKGDKLEKLIDKLCNLSESISAEGEFSTAVHEIGHALAISMLFDSTYIKKISIIPGYDYSGFVTHDADERNLKHDFIWYEKDIKTSLASKVAEELFWGSSSEGWIMDLKMAQMQVLDMLIIYADFYQEDGVLSCYLPRLGILKADDVIDEIIERYIQDVEEMFVDKKGLITELAGNLLIEKEMTAERFSELINIYESREKAVEDAKLCQKVCFALQRAIEYTEKDAYSDELKKKLMESDKPVKFCEIDERIKKCKFAETIMQILGFDIFDQKIAKKMILSKTRGSFAFLINNRNEENRNETGFAVFIDSSDRTGQGVCRSYCSKRIQKLSFDSIEDDTDLIYAKGMMKCKGLIQEEE